MIGQTLGNYKITAKLGEGGMGVVYRATDLKLGRDVALKVLPPALANNPERMVRFEREARLLASLTHTNIAAVYGVEQGALVMELVEGPTLEDMMRRGPMPVDEVAGIATQMAAGLEAAHDKGVIHRDLKPANVKVTPEGVVKLLDFGLAKAMQAPGTADDPEDEATLTQSPSVSGMIMGTPGYMSPEQARGAKVDKRTDIWAFGVVVYEMLAGGRLFRGETVADTLAAVISKEPDWDAIPPSLRSLVRLCLQRDKKNRLRDIGDFRLPLNEAPPAQTVVAATLPKRRWLVPALAGALLLALGSHLFRTSKQPELPVRRFTISQKGIEVNSTWSLYAPAISPDGQRVVYRAEGRLWVRRLDQTEARPLQGTQDGIGLFWAPDSVTIGFGSTGQIWKMSTDSGAPVAMGRVSTLRGGDWSTDGNTILFANPGGLWSVPAAGGQPRQVARAPDGVRWGNPSVLPAEAGPGWVLAEEESGAGDKIVALHSETGERRELLAGSSPRYSTTGHILFNRDPGLWAVPFSSRRLAITGEAFPLVPQGANCSVSRDGTLIYMDGASAMAQLFIRDRLGSQVSPVGLPQPGMNDVAVSPEGRRIAVSSTEQGSADVWIHHLDRSVKGRLTFDPGEERYPRWSPDGREVAFIGGPRRTFVVPADGGGEPRAVAEGTPNDWSPDGKYLLLGQFGEERDLWMVKRKPDGGFESSTSLLKTRHNETTARVSRNGRYFAHVSNETGRPEAFVRPFPSGGGKWQVSSNGAAQVQWSRDGRELYFLEGDTLMAVPVSTEGAFTAGAARKLFSVPGIGSLVDRRYDVLPDGRFVTIELASGAQDSAIQVVQNWPAAFQGGRGAKD